MRKSRDLSLRKIDVKSWTSPVAKQHRIRSLPHFILYDPSGKKIAAGFNVYKKILSWKDKTKSGSGKTGSSGKSGKTPPRTKIDPSKVKLLTKKGEKVDPAKHLVKGKYTMFEFYTPSSMVWWKVKAKVGQAVSEADDLVLLRVQYNDARSPVAVQHKLKGNLHYVLYDPKGKVVRQGADLYKLMLDWANKPLEKQPVEEKQKKGEKE